ncbi:Rpn family recombination-promoting nuclease/putative transposase [Rubneribacter sp.]|nr:Rpn family recombination-promoting nuclease/putative transposase [Candidatus Rubneribacter avistercoris]
MERRLPFSNRYVFAKVMQDNPDLCREILERILDIRIDRIEAIEVESEGPAIVRRGVRFDVFAKSDRAAFEVEMQSYEQESLPKRMRYYRSQLDRRMLNKGDDFEDLRPVYVIFICRRDPFGKGLPTYTFRSRCDEDPDVAFDNGSLDVVLNSQGDLEQARPEIASLLQFVETEKVAFADPLTSKLAHAVEQAHEDEEWIQNMSWLEWDIRDAKAHAAAEGRAEGHAKGLEEGREEGLKEGREEGREEGRAEGRSEEKTRTIEMLRAMKENGLGIEEALAALENDAPGSCAEPRN